MSPREQLRVFPDPASLARAAAEEVVRRAALAIERTGRFSLVLTGGSSPRELYRLLGEAEIAARVPWERVHLFWGDERAVPPAHPRSNFGMANALFVARVPVPAGNVHRIAGELGAERAAAAYESELRSFFGESPRFDLVHLGLGGDGHVASLFPFDLPRLLERERWTVASVSPQGEPRVTLTFPALNGAEQVEFLIPHARKRAVARVARAGPLDPLRIPAQRVRPASGALVWLLTEAAKGPE